MSNFALNALQIVQNLGLSEREAQAYLALLELGRASADTVARRANLKRATAYVALDSLLQQGLVLKVPRSRKMIFIAKDPEELAQRTKERLDRFDALIPSLRALSIGEKQFNTVLYEGIEGLRRAYWYKLDDLNDTEYKAFFGIAEGVSPEVETLILKWNIANAKRNICSQAIAPEHSSLKGFRETDATYLREVKRIPYDQYPNRNSIEIYKNFVRIVMFEELSAVIIESPSLAQSLASVHALLWKQL